MVTPSDVVSAASVVLDSVLPTSLASDSDAIMSFVLIETLAPVTCSESNEDGQIALARSHLVQ